MSSNERTLEFSKGEVLSDATFIHQIDNGTIFHRQSKSLWVNNDDGNKISVDLLGAFHYSIMTAQGDSVYYGSNWDRKIYQAVFKEPDEIETYHLRDMIKGENLHQGGLCSRVCDGKFYVYRVCDDPVTQKVHIDMPLDTIKSLELQGLYGETAIFRKLTTERISPSVTRMGGNAIVLSCYRGKPKRLLELSGDMDEYNSPWGSPAIVKSGHVYMSNGQSLFTIDHVEAKLLQPLLLWDISSFYIAGLYNGTLVGRGKCKKDGKYYVMTAELPSSYIGNEKMANMTIASAPPMTIDRELPQFSSKLMNEFIVKKFRGAGTFGCVFEAMNKYDKWNYAVKRVAVDESVLEKALGEVRAMAQLDHPHIVRYNGTWVEEPPEGWQFDIDGFDHSGYTNWMMMNNNRKYVYIYIQMQLCTESLFDWLRDHRDESSRSLSRMKMWFKQIVSAVDYIHKKNLIHRDLKPSNVLFVEDDHLKLCDLGIVTERSEEDESRTEMTRTSVGTMLYMSPEQRSCLPYSSKSDVFSLGLILAELCVVMTSFERAEIFHNFAHGIECDHIQDYATAEFIRSLTQVEQQNRPSCREMLEHAFLD